MCVGVRSLGGGERGSFASRNVRTHITRSDYLGARGRVTCFAETRRQRSDS